MPLYDYECRNCGHIVEVLHGVNATGPTACEQCGGPMRKLMSTPSIVFKGSGWAKKDFRDSKSAAKSGSKSTGEGAKKSSESSTGSDSGSSSESSSSSDSGGSKESGAGKESTSTSKSGEGAEKSAAKGTSTAAAD